MDESQSAKGEADSPAESPVKSSLDDQSSRIAINSRGRKYTPQAQVCEGCIQLTRPIVSETIFDGGNGRIGTSRGTFLIQVERLDTAVNTTAYPNSCLRRTVLVLALPIAIGEPPHRKPAL